MIPASAPDVPVRPRWDRAALVALAQAHPELGARRYRNMARYLAQRLRIASAVWAAAAG